MMGELGYSIIFYHVNMIQPLKLFLHTKIEERRGFGLLLFKIRYILIFWYTGKRRDSAHHRSTTAQHSGSTKKDPSRAASSALLRFFVLSARAHFMCQNSGCYQCHYTKCNHSPFRWCQIQSPSISILNTLVFDFYFLLCTEMLKGARYASRKHENVLGISFTKAYNEKNGSFHSFMCRIAPAMGDSMFLLFSENTML